jgi:hypothetical protein
VTVSSPIPAAYDWPNLLKRDGDELFDNYRHTLEQLRTIAADLSAKS